MRCGCWNAAGPAARGHDRDLPPRRTAWNSRRWTRTAVYFRPAEAALSSATWPLASPWIRPAPMHPGIWCRALERIEGDFFGVMGLPVRLVLDLLKRAGWEYRFDGRCWTVWSASPASSLSVCPHFRPSRHRIRYRSSAFSAHPRGRPPASPRRRLGTGDVRSGNGAVPVPRSVGRSAVGLGFSRRSPPPRVARRLAEFETHGRLLGSLHQIPGPVLSCMARARQGNRPDPMDQNRLFPPPEPEDPPSPRSARRQPPPHRIADHDLGRQGGIAEPGRHIDHIADHGVVEPPGLPIIR